MSTQNFNLPALTTSPVQATTSTGLVIVSDADINPRLYPKGMRQMLYPELHGTAPTSFDIDRLEQWTYLREGVSSYDVLKYIDSKDMLESCFDLYGILAIQARGSIFFRQYFAGKKIFAPRSAVELDNSDRVVPCIFAVDSTVLSYWRSLVTPWQTSDIILRFKN